MNHHFSGICILILAGSMFNACSENPGNSSPEVVDTTSEIPDWSAETHGKTSTPNFDLVFDNTKVNRLDIVLGAETWESMMANMVDLYGPAGGNPGGPPGGGPGGPGGLAETDEDPMYVVAEIFFNGLQWYHVGVRFKGNSSLQSTWTSGNLKLSFKLDFDEFEDVYPEIDNQRFYGFKQLNLKNNFEDKSQLREKVASEIFASAGLPSPHTAFYEVYLERGNGAEYFGLYTLVEEVDDTVIKTQFEHTDGNLYKPENEGASFRSGTFNRDDFEKKSNESAGDWSDIENLFSALHAPTRQSDAASWRAALDSVFDTEAFLKYLAVNTVIQNWDTYGRMTHNYYLYHDPQSEKLTWIPWDNNEALQAGKMGGSLNLDFSNLEASAWPLIEYLYADSVYRAIYDQYVILTGLEFFGVDPIQALYDEYGALVEPSIALERTGYSFLRSPDEFFQALTDLNMHVISRNMAIQDYITPIN